MHHIFHGISSNKKHSEEDGLMLPLCNKHHTGVFTCNKNAIHFNPQMELAWKKKAQSVWEEKHPGESFLKRYGRNYL